jgi:hypothetical protein
MSSDQNFVCVSYIYDASCIPTNFIILGERSEEFKSKNILCLFKIIIAPERNFVFIFVYCYLTVSEIILNPPIAPAHS